VFSCADERDFFGLQSVVSLVGRPSYDELSLG
jgi:hypothetical protein